MGVQCFRILKSTRGNRKLNYIEGGTQIFIAPLEPEHK